MKFSLKGAGRKRNVKEDDYKRITEENDGRVMSSWKITK
jgi:hypothetical protein